MVSMYKQKVFLLLLMLITLCFDRSNAQTYIINTVAGDGTLGSSGDGGTATLANLEVQYGVATGPAGRYYIATGPQNTVRVVNSSAVISTYAGTGTSGFSGDGGQATAATFNNCVGVCTDAFGNLYIADAGNNRVRMVNTSGVINTVAGDGTGGYSGDGGNATAAELNNPIAVAIDASSGNLYIADQNNNRIRVVSPLGVINTYAGNGTAGFAGDGGPAAAATAEVSNPSGVAVDAAGNLYIADLGNNRIRIVNLPGTINTFAGTGTAGFSGDGGFATSAELNQPFGVATSGSNVLVADMFNQRIRIIYASGDINSIAGNGTSGFFGDLGPALSAEFYNPVALSADAAGDIYISDMANNRIRELTPARIPSIVPSSGAAGVMAYTGEPFNTAEIAYGGTSVAAPTVSQVLFGAAWAVGDIYIHDVGTNTSATAPQHTFYGSTPDVIIGNNTSSPGDLIMAVAYCINSAVDVDFFDITNVGTTSLAITYNRSVTIGIAGMYNTNVVHMDLIAEHATLPALPTCNKFAITWDDPTNGIDVAEGDLSTYSIAAYSHPLSGGNTQPDVAGIQRNVGRSTDDIALLTFVDGSGNLNYAEYDLTTTPASVTPTVLDASTTFNAPRIDANDDYTTNALPSSTAQYEVVAQGGSGELRTYNNLSGSFYPCAALLDLTGYGYAPPYAFRSPVVAMMNPDQFAVFEWTRLYSGATWPDTNMAIMQPISRHTAGALSPNSYYCVDSNGVIPVQTFLAWLPATYPISVSSPVNYNFSDTTLNLFAWMNVVGSTYGPQAVEYKLTASGPGLSFRPGHSPSAVAAVTAQKAGIFPNPAQNQLTIINGTGGNAATNYLITDVAGRVLQKGAVPTGNTNINITQLVPGVYIITLQAWNENKVNFTFIKN